MLDAAHGLDEAIERRVIEDPGCERHDLSHARAAASEGSGPLRTGKRERNMHWLALATNASGSDVMSARATCHGVACINRCCTFRERCTTCAVSSLSGFGLNRGEILALTARCARAFP